jgi:hypothetical protein
MGAPPLGAIKQRGRWGAQFISRHAIPITRFKKPTMYFQTR